MPTTPGIDDHAIRPIDSVAGPWIAEKTCNNQTAVPSPLVVGREDALDARAA